GGVAAADARGVPTARERRPAPRADVDREAAIAIDIETSADHILELNLIRRDVAGAVLDEAIARGERDGLRFEPRRRRGRWCLRERISTQSERKAQHEGKRMSHL